MNNSLNLASKPFSNRILPWALTAIVLFVSLIGLFLVVQLSTRARSEGDILQAEINGLKGQEKALMDAAEALKIAFSNEQQQALPAAHRLVDRKTFNWSRLLVDLEHSLPNSVRVSRISVGEVNTQAGQTIAQLDLAVFTKNPSTIAEMVSSMHKEGIFQVEVKSQNLNKGRGESGTEYELYVIYRAPQSFSVDRVAEIDEARRGGEVPR